MAETGGRVLRTWLLIAVRELGGTAPRPAVHEAVRTLFEGQFSAEDMVPRKGRGGDEPAWRNNLDSLYDRLKKERIFLPSQRGGPWALSVGGMAEASALHVVGSGGLLGADGRFKPKNSGAYTANI